MLSRCFKIVLLCLLFSGLILGAGRMALAVPRTDKSALERMARFYDAQLQTHRGPRYSQLLSSAEPAQKALNEDPDIKLMYVDDRGRPMYYRMLNLNAAKTLSTNKVWPDGGYSFSLTGSTTLLGELGIWDGGGVRTTHQELTGRATQIDSPGGTSGHSTHVAGTMIAGGVQGNAKGMSYQGKLACYEWTDDSSEMAIAAGNGMKVSNHSYSYITGWNYNSGNGKWYWWGDTDISQTEDYYFGFYDYAAQDWDQIAHDAPYYTIVASAGNDRGDTGPGPGGGHYVWDNVSGTWVWSTTTRDPDGGADGYDCLDHCAIAKNVIAVGSVNDIPNGYSSPSDVVMTSYSSWGPADDGRIKPDLVANGAGLYSCYNTNNSSYSTLSGTSMASPNLSGSLNLLIHHYEATHSGTTPLASTMKAVLIQTADEAGANPGPDYVFGWGLMNTLKAANLIVADSANPFFIREDSLSNGQRDTLYFTSDGASPIRVSLAWTDPPGTPPSPSLNPTTLMLVHDLDLRLKHMESSTTYLPYVLNPSDPSGAATIADNVRDNAEQIHVSSPAAGHYMVTVSHKGTLSANQWYSMVASTNMTTTAPDLTPPVVTVVRPNGGEIFYVGAEDTIRWIATDNVGVDSVSIYYSTDGGASFPHTIVTGEVNDSTYLWTVPGTLSDTCRVKVVAYDAALNQGSDVSDGDFTIAPPDTTPPVVTVVRPNGGEVFYVGSEDTIRWIATDDIGVDSVSIYYSVDGGASFPYAIATGEVNDSTYLWTVPGTLSDTCRVKVVAYDAGLTEGSDVSDGDFTIASPPDTTPPVVTVVRPNGGEVFYVGSEDTIRWIATDDVGIDSVSIYYSTDGGASFPHTIATGEINDSTYLWTVPGTLSDTCRVKVVAYDAGLNQGSDISDGDFTIASLPDTTPPEVTVVRPNGGEVFYVGSEDTIRWIATDDVGVDSVSIYYSVDGGASFPYTIAAGEPNDSVYAWTVPDTPADSCIVKIVAYDPSLNTADDVSDTLFSIQGQVGTKTVTGVSRVDLLQNYPNPFNPVTRIEFSLGERARVFLAIYEISGKLVRILVNETEPAGRHAALWKGEDESGIPVASGVYVCRLEAQGKTAASKIVLLR